MAAMKQFQRLCRSLLLALSISGVMLPSAFSQDLDWLPIPYDYLAKGESLRDVLVNFGANYDASVVVSDKVTDQVNGHFEQDGPQEFLQHLSSLYNLVWYYDGSVLYVFKNSEIQSRLLKLEQTNATELQQTLKRSGIWEPRFGWRPDPGNQLVYVSGPPRYLELVDQTASALEQQSLLRSEKTGALTVEIFPLKYASVTDRQIQYRDSNIEAPGIATILSRLLSDANVTAVTGETSSPMGGSHSSRAVVQAEPSLNAIIVRDTPERMSMYAHLINALDKPSARIEVALSIVDINADNLSELGVDWQVGINTGPRHLIDITTTKEKKEKGESIGSAALGSLVDRRGLDYLLAKITLLESKGSAQVVSRPTLLTQENTQAVIDHNETYYVKINGERVAELKSLTYGTMLRMTPRVIQIGDSPEISLSLHIEDGNQKPNSTNPDDIPTISRTIVDTVARVGHGQSLLIGGIYRDEMYENLRKVPFLGDIPYLGVLFRSTTEQVRRSVRLFIIEPRIIDSGIAHHLALGNGQDLRHRLLATQDISNQSVSLSKVLSGAQCQPLSPARQAQETLRQAGKSSFLASCRMGKTYGWRVIEQQCSLKETWCVRAQNKASR
ncbi:EscC/YscC/HrcC family type III secretion system outer membrane ring protein [Photorhabdus temperata]|uniref:Type 3 secretion system secretin n=1 Tax=Photorhabdus khanii NC19 TaxID=1004151 RepID=W3VBL6_9GAMM|nr:type III secretion system outer membrane ring subunit SctC [Photorhabdus khanii]ETS33193.1 type III secretion outer membrane pore, YscC/HrcC family [Photorhabdus khanii NC19]OHV53507.1 EscC/YscC/HrcC family type III secretion system outer membrane ring protein [Photorhabdus temperata]